MLASQAKRISSFCISNGVISEGDREKYDYCYEILLATALNIAAVALIGLVTGFLAHTVCFMLVFALLKNSAEAGFASSRTISVLKSGRTSEELFRNLTGTAR